MQLGGAAGVALLGTALNIRYQNFMTPLLAHQQIPPSIDKVILGSLGGALAVSGHVQGKAGEALAQAARRGFVSGMDLGLLVATVAVAVAGLAVLAALPNQRLRR
jgi:DHA2 family multidrug resistance protein-like MFS transporter